MSFTLFIKFIGRSGAPKVAPILLTISEVLPFIDTDSNGLIHLITKKLSG